MFKKKEYVTEQQLNHITNLIHNRIQDVASKDTELLKYYRQTVQRHSEEINFLLKIIKEAGLVQEFNSETDNSVVEYLGTKWKIKKVK
jgi:uncharacterized protein YihD (DUF1040 family)